MGPNRIRLAALAVSAGLVLPGLAACGAAANTAAAASSDLTAEDQALAALGFDVPAAPGQASPSPSAMPSTTPSTTPGRGHKRPVRTYLRHNVMHGEVAVTTRQGPRTIAVQRGVVTAADAHSVTVKCTDGVVQTWMYAPKVTVRKGRQKADPGAVTVGEQVGIAGTKASGGFTARLVIVAAT